MKLSKGRGARLMNPFAGTLASMLQRSCSGHSGSLMASTELKVQSLTKPLMVALAKQSKGNFVAL